MLRLVLGRLSSNATALPINACSTQPQEWYGLGPPLIPSHPILLFGCRLSCFELGTCGVCVFQGGAGAEPAKFAAPATQTVRAFKELSLQIETACPGGTPGAQV